MPSTYAQKVPDQRVDTDVAGANQSRAPQIEAAGDSVFLVWTDDRNGNDDVYFNRSDDGGSTWLANDVRLDTDAAGTAQSSMPQLAVANGSVYVVWADARHGGRDIYANWSSDGGVTWLPNDQRLNTKAAGSSNATMPAVCATGTNVYVAWQDNRNGNHDIYGNVSNDSGATWRTSDLRLDSNLASAFDSRNPQIAASGNAVYVVWHDARNGGSDIFLNRSLDAGATWLASDVRINRGTIGITFAVEPRIVATGSHALVVWQDRRNGVLDVFCNRTTDSGSTWATPDVRLDTDPGASSSSAPRIAIDGTFVGVVWQDGRSGTDAVHANWSLDLGATWQPADRRLDNTTPGTTNAREPRIAIAGLAAHVAWTDDRNGQADVYATHSLDAGQTWSAADVRLDTDTPGASASTAPQIAATPDTAWVAWQDARNGSSDVHANAPFGMFSYGPGTFGTGGFIPAMRGRGASTRGGIVTLDVQGTIGGAPSAILVGFQPRSKISISFLGGTILVNPIASPPFPMFGPLDVPGAGNISIPIWLPTDPVFTGFNVNFQVVSIDSGSPFGWSMTNGVEMWIGE